MLTSVNRVTGVYESEVSVRMVLISNNNLLIYTDGSIDPYTNDDGVTMLTENQANIDVVIGTANYDIGHVFSTGGGGVATLNSPCNASTKARGVTGLSNPVGDAFDIDYVAHEMGHQYGAPHTFNSVTGSCSGNRTSSDAYEVGSATTIMGYAGICGSDNIQPNSDPFFHTISFDRISNFVEAGGAACRTVTATGNTLPVITAMNNNGANIPINTPFTLTASATDANGDALTYCWEEWDLGPATAWNGGNANTTSPLFKSRIPKTTGSRTFPDIAYIAANYLPVVPSATMGGLRGETLPAVARALKFRLTVRDNRAGGGGVVTGGDGCQAGFTGFFQVNTIATTGPFAVTVPNGGENYPGGSSQTITWNVVGTDAAPINVANVRISLSTDGGLTYPTVLAASTPNDGSESLTIPAVISNTARIKVEALGNIFFDISNANFIISAPLFGFTLGSPAPATAACPAPASMNITLTTASLGGFSNAISFGASGNPGGTTVSFVPPSVNPGTSTVVTLTGTNTLSSGSYVITVTGTASGAPTQTRDITYTINPGTGPAIITQPTNQTACAGSSATFTVAATGTYQWQVSTAAVPAFTNIGGAVSASYTVTGVTTGQGGNQYRCIVTGQCGSTTSNAAALTVNTAPAITTQPQDVTLCAGSNNTFTVAATGAGLTYQWQASAAGCAGAFANIAGATSASYTLTGITAGQNNTAYRCVVSGTCTPSVTSNCALLTVVTVVTVTTQPLNTAVCEGSNTSLTVAGSGTGIIYQWQVNPGTGFVNVPVAAPYSGGTTATLSITGASFALNGYQYRCQLSNATCTTPGVSNAATLTVNTLPAISAQPQNATICVGSNNTFSVTGSGTGVAYQWQISTVAVPAFTNIAGANASTYTVTSVTIGMNGNQYRCVVSGTCPPAVNSSAATLTVIAPVTVAPQGQPVNSEVCSGSTANFAVAGNSVEPIIYQWQISTVAVPAFTNISGANAVTLSLASVTTALSGNQYRCLLSNATCPASAVSVSATLTVRQLPSVGLTAAPLTSLLPGLSTTLTATPSTSTGGVVTTTWLYNTNSVTNTGNTRTVNIEQVGNYQVRIQEVWTSSLTCTNLSPVVTIDATVSSKLFIFPSPNDGQFTVAYYNAGGVSGSRNVTVYDSKGAKVHNQKFSITGLYTLLSIDLKPALKGIYYVVVGDAAGKKLIEGKVLVH